MKKRFMGIVAVVMASLCCVPMAVGCGGGSSDGDETKTILYINHYDGGAGKQWIANIETAFEAEYADYVNPTTGKVGVDVVPLHQKETGDNLYSTMGNVEKNDIYFTDNSKYTDMVANGYVLDITDVVTSVNSDGKTIESKLTERQKDYFGKNGTYYALPHYDSFGGLSFNVNIFESYEFYFKKGGAKSEFSEKTQALNGASAATGSFDGYKYTGTGDKSAGPDGLYGTYDDGLPATYEEFFVLCDRMVARGVTPFIWSSKYGLAYMNNLFYALIADYEGLDNLGAYLDMDGTTVDSIIEWDANGFPKVENGKVVTKSGAITTANGYEGFTKAGAYYAASFVKKMVSNTSYFDSYSTNGSSTHTDAQKYFVVSEVNPSTTHDRPIAMIVEGSYWENEAKDNGAFKSAQNYVTDDSHAWRYQLLPVPKVDESRIGEKTTINVGQGNLAFINKKCIEKTPEKIEIAKEFLKFCYSDAKLQEYTSLHGVTRGLDYLNTTGMNVDNLSYYAKSVIALKKNADVFYNVSGSDAYYTHSNYFSDLLSTKEDQYPLPFLQKTSNSADSLIKEIRAHRSVSAWNTEFGL